MKCPYCNHAEDLGQLPAADEVGVGICSKCRHVLMMCPHCQQANQGSAVYCRDCGALLRSADCVGGVSSITSYFPVTLLTYNGGVEMPIIHRWRDRFQDPGHETVDMLFFRDVLVLRNKIRNQLEIRQAFQPGGFPWLYELDMPVDAEFGMAVIEDLVVFQSRDKQGRTVFKTVDTTLLGIAEQQAEAVSFCEFDDGCEGFSVFPFGTADVRDQVLCLIGKGKMLFWRYSDIIKTRVTGAQQVRPNLIVAVDDIGDTEVLRAPLVHEIASEVFFTTSLGRVYAISMTEIRAVLGGKDSEVTLKPALRGGLPGGWLASAPASLNENFALECVRMDDGARVIATWFPEYDEFKYFAANCIEFEGEYHALHKKGLPALQAVLRRSPPRMRNNQGEYVVMIGCYEIDRQEDQRKYHVVNSSGFHKNSGQLFLSQGMALGGYEIWTNDTRLGILTGAASMDVGDILRDGELNFTETIIPVFANNVGKTVIPPVCRFENFAAYAGLDMVVIS